VVSKISRMAIATLAAVGLALVVPAAAEAAPAHTPGWADEVPCGPSDYLQVWWNVTGDGHHYEACYANQGMACFINSDYPQLDDITTGNNEVQWETLNGTTWSPNPPLGKWTNTVFNGQSFGCVRIL
jgi:hypothetical protein